MKLSEIQQVLSIADSDHLIAELRVRFDRMLFVGIRTLDGSKYDVKLRWKDVPTDGIGLARYAEQKITDLADDAEHWEGYDRT